MGSNQNKSIYVVMIIKRPFFHQKNVNFVLTCLICNQLKIIWFITCVKIIQTRLTHINKLDFIQYKFKF